MPRGPYAFRVGVGLAVVAAVWLATLSVFDLRRRRLPNWLTLPGATVILAVAASLGHGLPALSGAAVLFVIYLAVHLLAPAALGAGDVKLALGVGALTGTFGLDVLVLAALGAALCSGVWAGVVTLRQADDTVPHGVSMCVSAAAAVALAMG
ncbi:leader peptidase (prepilin peptidase) / N-methyltransferase [Mycolicibacterium rutilum]|uniref:Leader peptidase (Prepilin peptidase) / N-methyltransferase n=1 Tax=Mycolicibacterium rutilum TaxID=370526 RepID=A0A1H6LAU9_MYCRU|nr:leader peptidase (prepilin peptidase) / N-methyltransferase [Mycolicibacterium rutilum]